MNSQTLRDLAHSKVLLARKVEYLIEQSETLIRTCDYDELKAVEGFVLQNDPDGLMRFLRGINRKCASEMSITELRAVARRLKIPYYNELPKSSLLSEVLKREDERTSSGVSAGDADASTPVGD